MPAEDRCLLQPPVGTASHKFASVSPGSQLIFTDLAPFHVHENLFIFKPLYFQMEPRLILTGKVSQPPGPEIFAYR